MDCSEDMCTQKHRYQHGADELQDFNTNNNQLSNAQH